MFFAVVLLTVPLCMPVCASWVTESAPGSYQADLAPSGMSETMGGSVFGGGGVSIDGGGGGGSWSTPAAAISASPVVSGTGMWSYGGPDHNIWAQWGTTPSVTTNPITSSSFGTQSIALSSSNAVGSFFNNPTFSISTSRPDTITNGQGLFYNSNTGILGATGVWNGANQITFDFNNQSATFNLDGAFPAKVTEGTKVFVQMSAAEGASVGGNNFVEISFVNSDLKSVGAIGRDQSGSVVSTWKAEATEGGRMKMNDNEYMIFSGIGDKSEVATALGIKDGSDLTMNYKDGKLVQMVVDGRNFGEDSALLQAATPIAGSLAATGIDPMAGSKEAVSGQEQAQGQLLASDQEQPVAQTSAAPQGLAPLTIVDNQGTLYLSGVSKVLSFHDEDGAQIFGSSPEKWFATADGVVISALPGIWKDQPNNQGETKHYGNNVWAVVEDMAGNQRVVAFRSIDEVSTAENFVDNLKTADGKTYDIKGVSPADSTLETYGQGQVTSQVVTNLSGSAQEHMSNLLYGPVSINNWSQVIGQGSLFTTPSGGLTYVDNRWDEVFCGYVSTEALKGFGLSMEDKVDMQASFNALPGSMMDAAKLQDYIVMDPFFTINTAHYDEMGMMIPGSGSGVVNDRVRDHNNIIEAGYYGGQYSTIGISPLN